jgi:hypothetical protein
MNRLIPIMLFFALHSVRPIYSVHEDPKRPPRKKEQPTESKLTPEKPLSSFHSCGLVKTDWAKYNDIRLASVYVARDSSGFKPTVPGAAGAQCTYVAVAADNSVIGIVEAAIQGDSLIDYSIVPGALIGKPGGRFLLFPSDDPHSPPDFFPTNCETQSAEPRLFLQDHKTPTITKLPLPEQKLINPPISNPEFSDSGDT